MSAYKRSVRRSKLQVLRELTARLTEIHGPGTIVSYQNLEAEAEAEADALLFTLFMFSWRRFTDGKYPFQTYG
jgi:hypothetical protein